jgi:hypothetical protein
VAAPPAPGSGAMSLPAGSITVREVDPSVNLFRGESGVARSAS